MDADWTIVHVNAATLRLYGRTADQMVGRSAFDVFPRVKDSPLIPMYERVMRTRQPESHEAFSPESDVWLHVHAFPFGEGIAAFYRDLGPTKRLETELRREQGLNRMALAVGRLVSFVWDLETDVVSCSEGAEELFGFREGHVDRIRELVLPTDLPQIVHASDLGRVGEVIEGEYRVRTPHGVRTVLRRGKVDLDAEGRPIRMVGVWADITEISEAKARLAESETRLRLALESGGAGVWFFDPALGEGSWSEECNRLYGIDPSERGPRFDLWLERILPEDRPMCVEAVRRAIDTRSGYNIEYRLRHPELGVRWLVSMGRPLDGEPVRLSGITYDVTERKAQEAAIRELNAELERRVAERTDELQVAVRELEGFTYSVSHDLRSPLRAIVATSRMLQEEHASSLSEDVRELLQRQAAAANRMGVLIDELLKLSRVARAEFAPEPFDISALAGEVAAEIAAQGRYGSRFLIQPGLRAVGDPRLVRFVLLNLFENGAKFSRGESSVEFGHDGAAFFVRDRGIGFDMRFAGKLFRPFERLHRDDEVPGTGIGLANVHRIVSRHGGRVWAESAPGEGATFWFTLAA